MMHTSLSGTILRVCLVWLLVLYTVKVKGMAVDIHEDRDLALEHEDSKDERNIDMFYHANPTAHHFARHSLCSQIYGRIKFYRALEHHFVHISDDMKIQFILDICRRRDHMLDKWVREIFDINNDGYISHFEKERYVGKYSEHD